jgi:hypothetical protein
MRPLVNDTLNVLERIITLAFPVFWLVAPLLAVMPVYARPYHVVIGVW